jgi:hypothetical protein
MITVRQMASGDLVPLNPNQRITLTSLDGKQRAPLAVLLSDKVPDELRQAFGIHLVQPVKVPAGKRAVGAPRFELDKNGKARQVIPMEDAPPGQAEPKGPPSRIDPLTARLDALEARVAALEALK